MRNSKLLFGASAAITWFVYYFTSAPNLGLVDSGELTTVANTLGIAHPTGYPLYTLLGRIWQLLLPIDAARAMVLFSVTCAAAAIGVLANAAYRVLRNSASVAEWVAATSACALSLGLVFSRSVWVSVAYAEVYPLTLLIASLLLWIGVRVYQAEQESNILFVIAAFYIWGLGFGNHFTILWFFPLLLWLGVHLLKSYQRKLAPLLVLCAATGLGISINLYLPLRSSVEPLLDWSDPQSLSSLIRHLTAWQYRVWMFEGSFADFVKAFAAYLSVLTHDYGWLLTLFSGIGLVLAIRRKLWMLLSVFAVWLIGVGYNLNYSIPDISTYFVSFYAPLFILALYAFAWLSNIMLKRWNIKGTIIILACLPGVTTFASALHSADRHRDTFAIDYARAVIATLPDSSLVFQSNWDIQSPTIYLQIISHERQDVVMLDLALMQRPWYLKQQQRRYPQIFAGCEQQVAAFVQAVRPFEAGKPYNAQQLEAAYVNMINCLIEHHYRQRPVYIRDTRAIGHPGVAAEMPTYPGGYFFRIANGFYMEPLFDPSSVLQGKQEYDEREQYLLRQAAVATALRGTFSLEQGDTITARECLKLSAELAPGDRIVRQFADRMQTH